MAGRLRGSFELPGDATMAKMHSLDSVTVNRPLSGRIAAGTAAILLGAFLLLGTGFAHSELLHDAAHDSRHGFTFPCH